MQLDIMSSSDETQVTEPEVTNSNGNGIEKRKSSKPVMEKRRRARINSSLNQLKIILLEALKKDSTRHSKLEKADILEMTVNYLKNVERQRLSMSLSIDPSVVDKYKAGFNECRNEVMRFLSTCEGVTVEVRTRLLSHLASCIRCIHSLQTQSNVFDDNGFEMIPHQTSFVINGSFHGFHSPDLSQTPNGILSSGTLMDTDSSQINQPRYGNFEPVSHSHVNRNDVAPIPSALLDRLPQSSNITATLSPPMQLHPPKKNAISPSLIPLSPTKSSISPKAVSDYCLAKTPTKSPEVMTSFPTKSPEVMTSFPTKSPEDRASFVSGENALPIYHPSFSQEKHCSEMQAHLRSLKRNDNSSTRGKLAVFESKNGKASQKNAKNLSRSPSKNEMKETYEAKHELLYRNEPQNKETAISKQKKLKRNHSADNNLIEKTKQMRPSISTDITQPIGTNIQSGLITGVDYHMPTNGHCRLGVDKQKAEFFAKNNKLFFSEDLSRQEISKRSIYDVNNNSTRHILTLSKSPLKTNTKKTNPWRPWSDNNETTKNNF